MEFIQYIHYIYSQLVLSESSTSFLIRGIVVANPLEYPTIPLAPASLYTFLLRALVLLLFTGARRRSPAGCPTPVGKGGVHRFKARQRARF